MSIQCRYLGASSSGNKLVRVSKRMSELDMCSRREADSRIESGQVIVKGKLAEIGQKVDFDEKDIVLLDTDADSDLSAIVLNKPMGYVSGQPEDGHIPAIKLLTAENCLPGSMEIDNFFNNRGFVAAGRLDLNSTGLLIFTKSGVLAKKLVSTSGKIEKEYIVTVEKAQQLMRVELEKGLTMLPSPTHDLKIMTRGGQRLFGDTRPLKSVNAKWIERGEKLKIILKEGRKHQIRRMARELLGFHVVTLDRVRIGPVQVQDLPRGKWRPLTKEELETMLSSK
jgi:23S rRNA pseudouridine2604 synthase